MGCADCNQVRGTYLRHDFLFSLCDARLAYGVVFAKCVNFERALNSEAVTFEQINHSFPFEGLLAILRAINSALKF